MLVREITVVTPRGLVPGVAGADGEGQAGSREVTQNGDRLTGGLKPTRIRLFTD